MHRQIAHDSDNYTNHTEFEPERFMGDKPELDPREIVFGFGRRSVLLLRSGLCSLSVPYHSLCPGINLAQASLFAFCAMTLAVFDIGKAVENGVETTPDVDDAEYYEAGVR